MIIYQPYTYLIGWYKPNVNLNYWYYGCEYGKITKIANPANLWTTYFTSSELIQEMRKWHGEPDVVEVRCVFKTEKQTRRCESKILDKTNATHLEKWLNQQNGGENFGGRPIGYSHTQESCEKISNTRKEKGLSKGLKNPMSNPEALKNYYASLPERNKKLSIAMKKNGHVPPSRLGIKHTEETKRKISLNSRNQYSR